MAQDPRPGKTGLDSPFDKITDARQVTTPTRKAPDPITGRSERDSFYTLGGSTRSLDKQLTREANKRKNPSR